MSKPNTRGFTLVELLVVIAIIGVLVALLLPAVQAARESARKMTCSTRLRELAQAAITYESAKKRFPGAHEIVARNASAPLSVATALGGSGGGPNKVANWNVHLLPYLDQQQVFDLWNDPAVNIDAPQLTPFMPIYSCPSRQTPYQQGALTSFVANAGYLADPTDPAPYNSVALSGKSSGTAPYWATQEGHNGVFVDRVPVFVSGSPLQSLQPAKLPAVTTTDVDDGLSNTLMFSENLAAGWWGASHPAGLIRPRVLNINTMFMWMRKTDGNVTCATPPAGPAPGAPAVDLKINGKKLQYLDPTQSASSAMAFLFVARPSALHSGGVNVVFADKHTGFLVDGLDYDVYQQLMTTNAKKSDSYTKCYVLRAEDFGG